MITENEIIEKLCKEPFCLFLGSGISQGVGLPLGNEQGKMILKALGISDLRNCQRQQHITGIRGKSEISGECGWGDV